MHVLNYLIADSQKKERKNRYASLGYCCRRENLWNLKYEHHLCKYNTMYDYTRVPGVQVCGLLGHCFMHFLMQMHFPETQKQQIWQLMQSKKT